MKNLLVGLTFTTLILMVVDCYLVTRVLELDAQVTKLKSGTNIKFENMVERNKSQDEEISMLGDRVLTYTRNMAKVAEMHNDLKNRVDLLELPREQVVEGSIRTIYAVQKELLTDLTQGMRDSHKMEIEALMKLMEH